MMYDFENTIGGQLLAAFDKAIAQCVEHKGMTLAEWDELSAKRARQLADVQAKAREEMHRQENIVKYRQQADALCQYDADGQFVELSEEFDRSEIHKKVG